MPVINITLDDVFQFWRQNEEWNPKWQTVATEKGFDGWEAWRRGFLETLREATEPEWRLVELTDPLSKVPSFYGGPFKAWKEHHYQAKDSLTLAEIARSECMAGHDYIQGLMRHFPPLTIMSAVEDGEGRVIVVEGMHRACALAAMAREGLKHEGIVFLALGKLKSGKKLSFEHLFQKVSP